MATYKVIQDIEAEDKLLGPLTLKQFIFCGIAVTCLYLNVMALTRGASILMIFLVPPMLFTGFMAWPWSKDQPTEVWLIAKLRFFFKPRRRIWDQSGLKELVTITAPKREEKIYTDNLSQTEVKSRLQALASTIDSRGWAVKNVNVNLFAQPDYMSSQSDRLINPMSLPQEVSNAEVVASDDILDAQNNPTAQHLDQMIASTSRAHHQALVTQMQQGAQTPTAAAQSDYWFMNQPASGQVPGGYTVFDSTASVPPVPVTSATKPASAEEQKLLNELHAKAEKPKASYSHMRTINPLGDTPLKVPAASPKPSAPTPDPAILNLARNDDLNVATIAREANKVTSKQPPEDEVVISLR